MTDITGKWRHVKTLVDGYEDTKEVVQERCKEILEESNKEYEAKNVLEVSATAKNLVVEASVKNTLTLGTVQKFMNRAKTQTKDATKDTTVYKNHTGKTRQL